MQHNRRALYCRSIIVRRCRSLGATVWSQELQACVNHGSPGPQVHPPQNHSTTSHGGHRLPHRLISGQRHRGNTALPGYSNQCRPGGPPFYRPHPTSSSIYIQCSAGGRAFIRKCPRGLRWNQRAMTCDRSAPGTSYKLQSLWWRRRTISIQTETAKWTWSPVPVVCRKTTV